VQLIQGKTGHLRVIEKLRGKNIVKVFASNGCEHVIALSSKTNIYQSNKSLGSGAAYSFGFNVKGQLGHGDQNSLSVPKLIENLSRKCVTTVALSYYHTIFSCGNDLETFACGRNDYGQLG
jgi:RCC1 and BTB domain-containing protein